MNAKIWNEFTIALCMEFAMLVNARDWNNKRGKEETLETMLEKARD